MDRLQKIRDARVRIDNEQMRREREIKDSIENLESQVRKLAPRMEILKELALECQKYNIPLYELQKGRNWIEYDFESNGITHETGFVLYKNNPDVKFGIIGGGYCKGNLVIDSDGHIDSSDKGVDNHEYLWKLRKFVDEFNEFEKRFLCYIDNL